MKLRSILASTLAAALSIVGIGYVAAPAAAAERPELYTVNVANQAVGGDIREIVTHNGVTYFTSYSLGYGRSIWSITDANRVPEPVVDASPGTWTGSLANLFAFGDFLFFNDDPTREYDGRRPFMYQISTGELTEIKIDANTSFTSVSNFVEAAGDVYFVNELNKIWKVDTATGFAASVEDLTFTILNSSISRLDKATNHSLLAIGDKILLIENYLPSTFTGSDRFKDRLWVYNTTDDTLTNTGLMGVKLVDNYLYEGSEVALITDATNFQNFYFDTARLYAVGADGIPIRLGSWSVAAGFPRGFANYNGELFMVSYVSSAWRIDQISTGSGELLNRNATIGGGATITSVSSMAQIGEKLVMGASIGDSGTRLFTWDGTGAAQALGEITGPNPYNSIYNWTSNHGGGSNISLADFHGEILTNLYLDEAIGYEPYLIDVVTGATTLVKDMNTASDGSNPSTGCFATFQNLDFMTASVPLQTNTSTTSILLELKGEDELLKYSVIGLDGISGPCGFSVGGDALYFNGSRGSSDAIFRMNADRTVDELIQIEDGGDFGYFYDNKYYWTADNYRDSDLFVYDLLDSNPATAITQLTGEDANNTPINFGGQVIDDDSVEELFGIGSKLFFSGADNATGDDFIYMADLTEDPLVFQPINESVNPLSNDLNPQDLKVIADKLYFFDSSDPTSERQLYAYDTVTEEVTVIIDPRTIVGNESFSGWNGNRPFSVNGVIYGLFYNSGENDYELYRTTDSGTEKVVMPENFDLECAAPAGSDYVISDINGVAYFYGDPENARLIPYSFSGNTSALCNAVTSEQGTYFGLPEYPFSSGHWSTEPGYIGLLAPLAVERLGEPVNEPPSVPYSDDPTALSLEAPGVPGTPAATQAAGGIKVTWTAPTSGDEPTSYVVTSSPAGATCTVTDLEALCTGLEDGTSYTFNVRAVNGGGSSLPAGPSNSVTYSATSGGNDSGDTPQVDPNLPVVTPNKTGHNSGGDLEIEGTKLVDVTKAFIDGKEVVISYANGKLTTTIPTGLVPGKYSLRLEGSFGSLILQDYLTILGSTTVTGNQDEMRTWTSISDAKDKVRIIYKNPLGVGKVQFMLNGKEIAWVRATDSADPKLRSYEVDGVEIPYLVRSVELTKGIKNAFEIYVDGVRVWRAAYFGR